MPATDHWEYGAQDPSGSLDCVCQVQEIPQVCHMVLFLLADILGLLGAQVKAFALVGYSCCNSRLVGLGQNDL